MLWRKASRRRSSDGSSGFAFKGANDQLLSFHDEEEYEACKEGPGPNPGRNSLGFEERQEYRCVSE